MTSRDAAATTPRQQELSYYAKFLAVVWTTHSEDRKLTKITLQLEIKAFVHI